MHAQSGWVGRGSGEEVVVCLVLRDWRHSEGHGGYLDVKQHSEVDVLYFGCEAAGDRGWVYAEQGKRMGWLPLGYLKPLCKRCLF